MHRVAIELNDAVFEDYIRFVFKSPHGDIKVKQSLPLGKYISSQVKFAKQPRLSYGKANTALIISFPSLNHLTSNPYFDQLATTQINKAISFYLDADFREFCILGYEKKMKLQAIVAKFIEVYNISGGDDAFERFKKREYRRRKKIDEMFMERIRLFELSEIDI
mgnify:CR=1 FL=1